MIHLFHRKRFSRRYGYGKSAVTWLFKLASYSKTSIMRIFFIALTLAVMGLSSCRFLGGERISGDGHVVSQPRNVTGFNSLDISGGIKVHIRQDAVAAVKVEADQNLMEYIEVFTDGSTLVIKQKDGVNLNPSKDIIVSVAAPIYKDIEVSGACDIIGDGPITGSEEVRLDVSGASTINLRINVPKLHSELSGSSHLNLNGQVADFWVKARGACEIKSYDLITDNTTLDVSGASDAEVTVNKKLEVEASGASKVLYKGKPSISQNSSGASEVRPAS